MASARIDLRVPENLKSAYFDACEERGLTPSDEIRRFMEQQLEEWKADEMGRAMKLLGRSSDPNVQEAVRILSKL